MSFCRCFISYFLKNIFQVVEHEFGRIVARMKNKGQKMKMFAAKVFLICQIYVVVCIDEPEIRATFHREKRIINELMDEDLYISPEYLEDSIKEIITKKLDVKMINTIKRVIIKLPQDNFVNLFLAELKYSLENYKKK